MAVIDWWNGPLTLVVIFFALCLLLLTWSIACVACHACHSSGTFFSLWHTHMHTRTHTHTHTHTHTRTHFVVWSAAQWARPGGAGSSPVEGNGHFFPSICRLYLSSFSDTHTHTHTHTHTRTHARTHGDTVRCCCRYSFSSSSFAEFSMKVCLLFKKQKSSSVVASFRTPNTVRRYQCFRSISAAPGWLPCALVTAPAAGVITKLRRSRSSIAIDRLLTLLRARALSKNADFFFKRTSSYPPPFQTNIVRLKTNIVRLKENADKWRRPLRMRKKISERSL